MKRGHLSDYFGQFAVKRLTPTEVDPKTSHGHEFQGFKPLKKIFGTERLGIEAWFIYFSDSEEEGVVSEVGSLRWYNAREKKPRPSEYRLYYQSQIVEKKAKPGDLLIVARTRKGQFLVVIVEANSTAESQIVWLFGIERDTLGREFDVRDVSSHDKALNLSARSILDHLGITIKAEDSNQLSILLEAFPDGFPVTREFSSFARSSLALDIKALSSDELLTKWMEHEELLFKALERYHIAERLKLGFDGDVDSFIAYSLTVQNRRKSRAGFALQNHLEAILKARGIRYDSNKVTENNSKPDFIFPGIAEYRDPATDPSKLTVLGVKTTCKDRWRQVLAEASRVPAKHLLTLEPGISENQTKEMQSHQLQLVLPKSMHETYRPTQQKWLMNVDEFIALVQNRNKS